MNLMTALRIALNALVIHKGRSVLTSLGIIIGTGAVISMVSAAGGAPPEARRTARQRRQDPHHHSRRRSHPERHPRRHQAAHQ